jgi:hypothetical protein
MLDGAGKGTLSLVNVVLSAHRGSVIQALWASGRSSYSAALGAATQTMTVLNSSVTVDRATVEASGHDAVTSAGFLAFDVNDARDSNGYGKIQVDRATIRVAASTVTTRVSGNAAVSVGIVAYASSTGNNGASSSTVTANNATIEVQSSDIAAYASGHAVASVGVVSYSYRYSSDSGPAVCTSSSTLAVDTAAVSSIASNVTALGNSAVSSVGFASYAMSDGAPLSVTSSSVVNVKAVTVIVALTNATSFGSYAVASGGFASYSRSASSTSTITVARADVLITRSDVVASATQAVASAAIANVAVLASSPSRSQVRVTNATVSVCSSRVLTVGRVGVAAAGAASTVSLSISRTRLAVVNSMVALGIAGAACSSGTPCSLLAMASFAASKVDTSATTDTRSNRLLLLGSSFSQASPQLPAYAPTCANLGNATTFDLVLVGNTTFDCGGVGWAQTQTSVASGSAWVFNISNPLSLFPGASSNGSLVVVPTQACDAEALCAYERDCGLAPTSSPLLPQRSATYTLHSQLVVRNSPSWTRTTTQSRLPDGSQHPGTSSPLTTASVTLAALTSTHRGTRTATADALFVGTRSATMLSRTVPVDSVPPTNLDDAVHPPLIANAVTVAATGSAGVAAVAAGLVGLPVASRPAVVGAAVRLSACVADGDGPEVPPYEAMPVQFVKLGTTAATSGLATATNTAFVLACVGGSYAVAREQTHINGDLFTRASLAHVAATVPLSYIGPAVAEFSVSWMTAAAAGTAGSSGLGYWWVSFAAGVAFITGSCLLLLWAAAARADDQRWTTLVGPLVEATRDEASPRVRYAFFVELGTSLLFSALSGIRVESLCAAKCVAATLVALAFLGYLVVIQPARSRMDHWFGAAFAALQALTGALVTAAVLGGRQSATAPSWATTAMDAAQTVNLVTLALLILQASVGVAAAAVRMRRRSQQAVRHDSEPSSDLLPPLLSVPCVQDSSRTAAGSVRDGQYGSPSRSITSTYLLSPDASATGVLPSNPLHRCVRV